MSAPELAPNELGVPLAIMVACVFYMLRQYVPPLVVWVSLVCVTVLTAGGCWVAGDVGGLVAFYWSSAAFIAANLMLIILDADTAQVPV